MIDSDVIQLAKKKAQLLIDKQNPEIDRRISLVKAQAAANGMLHSSRCVLEIARICKEATEERTKFVWSSLLECLTAAGLNYFEGLGDQAQQFVAELCPEHANWAKYRVEQESNFMASPAMKLEITRQVETANAAALQSVSHDIDLFILTLKNNRGASMPGHTVNISNAHNIVVQQAGGDASANVTQSSENQTNAELIALLGEIKATIQGMVSVPGHSKQDLAELIDDTATEVAKVTPNKSKLNGYFHALVDAVKGVSTLVEKGPVIYEKLRGLAEIYTGITFN